MRYILVITWSNYIIKKNILIMYNYKKSYMYIHEVISV